LVIGDGSYLDSPTIGLSIDETYEIIEKAKEWFDEVIVVRGVYYNQAFKRNHLINQVPKGEYYLIHDDDHLIFEGLNVELTDNVYRAQMTGMVGEGSFGFLFRRGTERYEMKHYLLMDKGEGLIFDRERKDCGIHILHFKHDRERIARIDRLVDHVIRYERRYLIVLGGTEETYWKHGIVPENWFLNIDHRYLREDILARLFIRVYHEHFGIQTDQYKLKQILFFSFDSILDESYGGFEQLLKFKSEEPVYFGRGMVFKKLGIHVWTERGKQIALKLGWPCCPSYFSCLRDPPPYERGACCSCMKDVTWKDGKWVKSLCGGCKRLEEKEWSECE